jgi:hypothetical protein
VRLLPLPWLLAGHPQAGCRARLPTRTCRRLQGGFQYWLYNHLFVRMCAGMTARMGHLGSAPIKTFIDQAIQ